jgi:hypothetical protein
MITLIRLSVIAGMLVLSACAGQPVEAQLATACNQIATGYRSAAILKANGKLSASAIDMLHGAEPLALSACDPTHPPTDLTTALANATAALQTITLAQAGVK